MLTMTAMSTSSWVIVLSIASVGLELFAVVVIVVDVSSGLRQLAEVPADITLFVPTARGYAESAADMPATVGQVMAARRAADAAADAAQQVRNDVEQELRKIRLVIRSILGGHVRWRLAAAVAVLLGALLSSVANIISAG
jgi:hypothetical protein